ncbi:MAG: hypothetical protein K2M77_07790, partial [Muribaculaceae bacterium]|nr:hypothetical protein [Muribaculaceae bacterium]
MEMCDPSTVGNAAEEQTLKQTPVEGAIESSEVESAASVADGEALAEDEMTEAVGQQAAADTQLTIESLLVRVKELAERPISEVSGDELRRLRQLYVTLHKNK